MKRRHSVLLRPALVTAFPPLVHADQEEELAKKLANPIAELISVPFQFNYDRNIGSADDGTKPIWTSSR